LSQKAQAQLNEPILAPSAVNECIQLGHHWAGDGLPWPIREIRQGHSGNLASQRLGNGIDFTETRPFQTGDNPRHMNWRATARTGRQQVRVFQQDQALVSYFLLDRRFNMRFGTRERLKVTQAARVAIFLASWEEQRGTELGSLVMDDSLQWQPPVSGHDGIYRLAQLASKSAPPLFDPLQVEIKLALSLLAEKIPPGSNLYLLSDFFDLDETMLPGLYRLAEQHRVWALNIHDVAEQELPEAGYLQLVWDQVSSVTDNIINTADADIQIKQRTLFEQRQSKIKNLCDRAGIFYTSISSQQNDIAKALQTSNI